MTSKLIESFCLFGIDFLFFPHPLSRNMKPFGLKSYEILKWWKHFFDFFLAFKCVLWSREALRKKNWWSFLWYFSDFIQQISLFFENAIFVYDMSADALTDALLNCEYEKLEEDFIMRIYRNIRCFCANISQSHVFYSKISWIVLSLVIGWMRAGRSMKLKVSSRKKFKQCMPLFLWEGAEEKYKRFFQFVSIPQVIEIYWKWATFCFQARIWNFKVWHV